MDAVKENREGRNRKYKFNQNRANLPSQFVEFLLPSAYFYLLDFELAAVLEYFQYLQITNLFGWVSKPWYRTLNLCTLV